MLLKGFFGLHRLGDARTFYIEYQISMAAIPAEGEKNAE